MILGCLGFLIVVVIINSIKYSPNRGHELTPLATAVFALCYVVAGVSLIVAIFAMSHALHDYGELMVYEQVRQDYIEAISRTTLAVVKEHGWAGLFSNKSHSTNISDAIQGWRHYEQWAKETRSKWTVWNDHYLWGLFVPDPPAGL